MTAGFDAAEQPQGSRIEVGLSDEVTVARTYAKRKTMAYGSGWYPTWGSASPLKDDEVTSMVAAGEATPVAPLPAAELGRLRDVLLPLANWATVQLESETSDKRTAVEHMTAVLAALLEGRPLPARPF